jgi:uncharacterized membrane protein YphA (DoxX/SURF4 family)
MTKYAHWAPIPLRLIVGYGFMAHGYAKVLKGPERFVDIVHAMGVPNSIDSWRAALKTSAHPSLLRRFFS